MSTNTNITVTGVDFGSSAVKIAAVLKGGVEIITNQANFRQTPNVVGFSEKQRLIGEAGQVKIKSNHSNTVIAPSRYLGFNNDCHYLSQQLKFCPARPKGTQNGLIFNLSYGQGRQQFVVQQLVASYLTQIQKIIAQTNNLTNKNMVIAVPVYFTQHERKSLMDAVEIAKKKINNQYSIQLTNEEVAISMDYGFSKKNQFSEDLQKSKRVLFIDFGHSKTNAFVTAFNKQHMRILASKFQRQLGCKFMDQQLLKFYAEMFDKSHPNMQLNLMQSKKSVLKLLENIERQRKVLSGNFQHDLSIECLLEQEDIHYSMKRDQYQKICLPILEKFKKFLSEFIVELKQKGINFDSIELIGGGTRIPSIISSITQVFGSQPSRTINSSQCIARGAALISAMNSSIFKVQPYNYFTISPYTVALSINGVIQEKKLIDKNELLLREKSVQFVVPQLNQNQRLSLKAEYEMNGIEGGIQQKIFVVEAQIISKNNKILQQNQTQMKEQSQESKTTKLNLMINLNESGLIIFNKLTSSNSQVKININKVDSFPRFTLTQLNQMEQKQKQMTLKDLKIRKFYEKKNEYESLIYKNRDLIQKSLSESSQYFTEEKSKSLRSMIENQQIWLNSDLQNAKDFKIQDFTLRASKMNKAIEETNAFISQLKQSHDLVNGQLQKLAKFLNQIIQKRSEDMYPEEVNKAGQWINQVFEKQKSQPKSNPPVVTVEQVKQIYQNIVNKINQFDQQMQRQRQINFRKTRQQPQRFNQGYQRQPQSTFTPHHGYMGRNYDNEYYKPRTTRNNRSGHYNNSSNPFGSVFGSGFSGFF